MGYLGPDMSSITVKAVIYGEDGACLESAHVELSRRHTQPDWREQDPNEVWQAPTRCISQLAESPAVYGGAGWQG